MEQTSVEFASLDEAVKHHELTKANNDKSPRDIEAAYLVKMTKSPLFVQGSAAVDLEAPNNTEVAAIGAIVGDGNGVPRHRLELWVKEECLHFSTDCRENFWEKNKPVYDKVKRSKRTHKEQIPRFVKFWDTNAQMKDLPLLSNNPEFDYSRLTPYVKKYCDREPIRYTTDGRYRRIFDLGHVAWNLGIGDLISEASKEIVSATHFPAEDAENIYLENIITDKLLLELKRKYLLEMRKLAREQLPKIVQEIKDAREKVAQASGGWDKYIESITECDRD